VREAILSPIVKQGDNLLLDDLPEGCRVPVVLHVFILVERILTDLPSIVSMKSFTPPAIHRADMQTSMDECLLAAGSAGFHGPPGGIQPDISAGNQVAGNVDVVVLDEHNLAEEILTAGKINDLLDECLSRIVPRMSFPGEHDLYRTLLVVQHPESPVEIAKKERSAFIGCKAPREPDRKNIGGEHGLEDSGVKSSVAKMLFSQLLAGEFDQFPSQSVAELPQILVTDLSRQDRVIPVLCVLQMSRPLLPEMFVPEGAGGRSCPTGDMNPVRDRDPSTLRNWFSREAH
jgi:hypothetical protein